MSILGESFRNTLRTTNDKILITEMILKYSKNFINAINKKINTKVFQRGFTGGGKTTTLLSLY